MIDPVHFFMLPTSIYGWIAIFAFIISGVLFVRNNDVKSLRSANSDLRALIGDKQAQITDLQTQIDKLRALVDKLQAVLAEKDKRIDALEHVQIVQQSNPEVIAYMQDMRTFTTQAHQYMIDSTRMLTEINAKK